jgi:hypothetical protein
MAIGALIQANRAGLRLRLAEDGKVMIQGTPEAVPVDLLARLRQYRDEIVALLRGDPCRHCGKHLAWPGAVGVVFGDNMAACLRCYEKVGGRIAELSIGPA